jgi:hypothetical protein
VWHTQEEGINLSLGMPKSESQWSKETGEVKKKTPVQELNK